MRVKPVAIIGPKLFFFKRKQQTNREQYEKKGRSCWFTVLQEREIQQYVVNCKHYIIILYSFREISKIFVEEITLYTRRVTEAH